MAKRRSLSETTEAGQHASPLPFGEQLHVWLQKYLKVKGTI